MSIKQKHESEVKDMKYKHSLEVALLKSELKRLKEKLRSSATPER